MCLWNTIPSFHDGVIKGSRENLLVITHQSERDPERSEGSECAFVQQTRLTWLCGRMGNHQRAP
jgi:hypothetical protein